MFSELNMTMIQENLQKVQSKIKTIYSFMWTSCFVLTKNEKKFRFKNIYGC